MATPTPWPQAMATVTACKYEFGAGRALAFGAPSDKHFLITFNYWANGELHTGDFTSEKAIPQGTLFPITYNPEAPHEHSQSSAASTISRPTPWRARQERKPHSRASPDGHHVQP